MSPAWVSFNRTFEDFINHSQGQERSSSKDILLPATATATSSDHHNKMASGLHVIVLLCLTSGLWIGADAKCAEQPGDCCETCPPGWTQFGGRCYLFQYSEMDWADAERSCTSLGGNLASLQTADEYTFLREMIYRATNSHKTTWVGGYDAVKEGVWLWSDGSKFVFKGWAKNEPNNLGGEGCMEINLQGKDFVNDAKCGLKKSFVCARNP